MKIPYEEIANHLKNRSDSYDNEVVEKWLKADPEHEVIYQSLKEEWIYLNDNSLSATPDRERVWANIKRKTGLRKYSGLCTRRTLWSYVSATACIVLLLCLAFFSFLNPNESQMIQFTAIAPLGEKSLLILPDSTKVWLNSGSTLTYSSHPEQRLVHLQGEAFFDVRKDLEKDFVVNTEKVSVHVYGTSFNLSAYDSDPEVEVSLEMGSVSLINLSDGNELAKLIPNEKAVVTKSNMQCRVFPDDAKLTKIWTDNVLKIYDNDIYTVVKKLERWYGIDIKLENIQNVPRYTFIVKTESLKELLDLVDKITPIAYHIEGKEVVVRLK